MKTTQESCAVIQKSSRVLRKQMIKCHRSLPRVPGLSINKETLSLSLSSKEKRGFRVRPPYVCGEHLHIGALMRDSPHRGLEGRSHRVVVRTDHTVINTQITQGNELEVVMFNPRSWTYKNRLRYYLLLACCLHWCLCVCVCLCVLH